MPTRLHSSEPQPVTFVELFFDLVFVFAVTQVTVLTAGHLDAGGVARCAVLFWLIWWAWTQFTWTLSPADTRHTLVQAITLAATASAFVMAAAIPDAFEEGVFWFVVPYVVIRVLGLALQVRLDREVAGEVGISMSWVYVSSVGLVVVFLGGLVDNPARTWIWVAAIVIDLVAASRAGSNAIWDLDASHFSERHGLFVIIALGESLIVTGTSVSAEDRTGALVVAAGGVLVVTCLLWWTYFGQAKEAMEEAFAEVAPEDLGETARDAYSLGHFPLICGIIGFAVAVKELVHHPEEPLPGGAVAALAIGIGMVVGATAFAFWRTTGRLLVPRLVVITLTMAGVGLARDLDPVWPLTVIAVGLAAIVVTEERADVGDADDLGEATVPIE